mgnify:CR=1 FL=1
MPLLEPLLIAQLAVLGIATGFLAGLLGIGGGMLMVPFITLILNLASSRAIGRVMPATPALDFQRTRPPPARCRALGHRAATGTGHCGGQSDRQSGCIRTAQRHVVGDLFWPLCKLFSHSDVSGQKTKARAPDAWDRWATGRWRRDWFSIGSGGCGRRFQQADVGFGKAGFARSTPQLWQFVATYPGQQQVLVVRDARFAGGEAVSQAGRDVDIWLPALIVIALCSFFMAPVGARLAHALPVSTLKKVFASILYGLAAYMLYKGVAG